MNRHDYDSHAMKVTLATKAIPPILTRYEVLCT